MLIISKPHTYKGGPYAGVTTISHTIQAHQGAYQIDYAKTLGCDEYGVSFGSTSIATVGNLDHAKAVAFYVSRHTDGNIKNMRALAIDAKRFCEHPESQ